MFMRKRDIEFVEKVGSRRTLSLTLTDDTGTAIDMSSTTSYSTGRWKVWKPDGTLLINGTLTFTTRSTGFVSYVLVASDTVIANAGVWEGEVEILDDSSTMVVQSSTFTFTILESY
jgi:hypothetical protein|tara:strand:+ start:76 stop:423 length:348 start_codon:yes stop_codon:yes gene_type:complete